MSPIQTYIKPLEPYLKPRNFFIVGGLGIALLAVYGRFEHSPRWLHQIAWAFTAMGAFIWMAGKSREEPNVWKGAGKALFAYWILGAFLLYPILMSDGDFYYGVIRSILWDRDTNTHNEAVRYAHGWLAEQGPKGGPFGFPNHPFPIGASLSWILFIAAGHAEALLRRVWDPWLALDGYSEPYLNWLAVGTATWGGSLRGLRLSLVPVPVFTWSRAPGGVRDAPGDLGLLLLLPRRRVSTRAFDGGARFFPVGLALRSGALRPSQSRVDRGGVVGGGDDPVAELSVRFGADGLLDVPRSANRVFSDPLIPNPSPGGRREFSQSPLPSGFSQSPLPLGEG